jgi:hypothetical protein
MLERIFPKTFDNSYRGQPLGLWIFVLVVLFRAVQCVNSILLTRMVATGADGIPLDRFDAQGAETVLAMFALLGLYLLAVPVISAVALVRYRSMIPFLYVMLLFVQLGARLLLWTRPISRATAMPVGLWINLGLIALTAVGLALSLMRRR